MFVIRRFAHSYLKRSLCDVTETRGGIGCLAALAAAAAAVAAAADVDDDC